MWRCLKMEKNGGEENFIHTITQYPFLYDKREKDFKNIQLKSQTWLKIGKSFGITGDEAAKYFKSLREKYLRIKREKAKYERSGAAAFYKEKWHLFDLLTFLEEVSRPRKTISNSIRSATSTHLPNLVLQTQDTEETQDTQDTSQDTQFPPDSQDIQEWQVLENTQNEDTTVVTEINIENNISEADLVRANIVTPVVPSTKCLNIPGKRKKQKLDEKFANTLESIANSLSPPFHNNEYIHGFCNQLEQEMLQMPPDIMEEFKDEVMEILLQKRRQIRMKKNLNNTS